MKIIDKQCRAGNLANADKWKIAFAILVWHWFWPEFEIGNWLFLVFFGFFLVFFGLSFGQYSKLETGFWVFLVFFWFFLGFFGFFLAFDFRVRMPSQKTKRNQKKPKKNQKNPKKNQKKPVATPKLVNWLGFFGFFGFFWFFLGEHPPMMTILINLSSLKTSSPE